jgi:hypothetical protein
LPSRMVLKDENGLHAEVNPVFVGYKPVIFALPPTGNGLNANQYLLSFYAGSAALDVDGLVSGSNPVARMLVTCLSLKFKSLPSLKLLQGKSGSHVFMNAWHRQMNSLRGKFQKSEPGNVNLPGNQHDMVRIAYSVPRIIALVSIAEGSMMNLFPTDLHGQVDNTFYLSSLRIGGRAQEQVHQHGRIVVCEMETELFREVYHLGKNHMKQFLPVSDFKVVSSVSEKFRFPLPIGVLKYFELTVLEFVDVGIHRIFLYRIENIVNICSGKTLSHIHQYYAQWRERNGMKTDILLR